MLKHLKNVLAASLLLTPLVVAPISLAKPKQKPALPAYVLQAHTVAVIIDPKAGVSPDDPQANLVAKKDVETALTNWGRFFPVISTEQADLIIVLRRSSGKLVNATVSDPRQNDRPGSINSNDSGISIGAQHGQQPRSSNSPFPSADSGRSYPQAEVAPPEDSFLVFKGNFETPLDEPLNGPPGWRYTAKDALKPHTVPVVAEFRKAIEEAEKAAAAKNP